MSIGVLVPLTGPTADSGRGALESVLRVVEERSAVFAQAGLDVEVTAADDRGQQSVGQQQATILADDPRTIGIIGSTESRVDEGVQPILARSGLLTLSLGGSEPALTRVVAADRAAFSTYLTLSAQRLDRPRVAAALIPRRDETLVLRGPRREDAAMAAVFVRARSAGGAPVPVVRSVPSVSPDEPFDAVDDAGLRMLLRAERPDAVYVAADRASDWASVLTVRSVLPQVPVIADEDVLGPWPEAVRRADDEADKSGVPWGPLWTTTAGSTPTAAEVAWPSTRPASIPTTDEDTASQAQDEAIASSRFSVAAHDAAEALLNGLLAVWAKAPTGQRQSVATPPSSDGVAPVVVAWRSALAREVRTSRQRGLLGPYVFDVRGVASRRLVGVFRGSDQSWVEGAPREVIGSCGAGTCAVRVR